MNYYSVGEFAKLIGVTTQTLRNWDKEGKLKPHHVGTSGFRYYSDIEYEQALNFKGKKAKLKNKSLIYYSNKSEKEAIEDYMAKNEISASLLIDSFDSFLELFELITSDKVEKIYFYSNNSMNKNNYSSLKNAIIKHNIDTIVINN